jgi:type I restriction enzyme S subunit
MSPETVVLPRGWISATIPDLIGADGLLSDGDWVETKDQDPKGEVRLTQLADVGDGVFRNRSRRFLTATKAHEMNCTFLQPGDVMIARMPDPLGRACIFPGATQPSITAVDVCIVRPGHPGISSQWLMHFINSPSFRARVSRLQRGSTRKRISKANLCTISLPVPPTGEQVRVAQDLDAYLTRLDNAHVTLERVNHNLERYRASVLRAAVAGSLVPHEAELAQAAGRAFEPAHELLKRLIVLRSRSGRVPSAGLASCGF